jgi:hypothetical protein
MVLQLIGAATSWNTLRAHHVIFEKRIRDVEFIDISITNRDQKVVNSSSCGLENELSDTCLLRNPNIWPRIRMARSRY